MFFDCSEIIPQLNVPILFHIFRVATTSYTYDRTDKLTVTNPIENYTMKKHPTMEYTPPSTSPFDAVQTCDFMLTIYSLVKKKSKGAVRSCYSIGL